VIDEPNAEHLHVSIADQLATATVFMRYRYASGESTDGQNVLQQLVTSCASWRSLQRLWEIEVRIFNYYSRSTR
jgi:hypothetical protein